MGRVCRICDRKFFLRASYQSYANEIEFYTSQKQQLQHTKEQQESKLQTLANDIGHVEKLIQTEAVNYIEKDSAKRLELEMLSLEQDRIERDKITTQQKTIEREEQAKAIRREIAELNNKKAEIMVELQKANMTFKQTLNQLETIQKRVELHRESVY